MRDETTRPRRLPVQHMLHAPVGATGSTGRLPLVHSLTPGAAAGRTCAGLLLLQLQGTIVCHTIWEHAARAGRKVGERHNTIPKSVSAAVLLRVRRVQWSSFSLRRVPNAAIRRSQRAALGCARRWHTRQTTSSSSGRNIGGGLERRGCRSVGNATRRDDRRDSSTRMLGRHAPANAVVSCCGAISTRALAPCCTQPCSTLLRMRFAA